MKLVAIILNHYAELKERDEISIILKKEFNDLSSKYEELMKDKKMLKDMKQVESRKPKQISKYAECEGKPKQEIKSTPLN